MYGLLTNPWIILSFILISTASHGYAYYKGYQSRDKAAQLEVKKELEAKLEAYKAYDLISREFVKKLQEKEVETKIVYRTIKEKVKDETRGRVCFDDGANRMWNDALKGSLSEAPTRAPEKTTRTYSDEVVLGNAVENFEQYKQCRDQLNALITWHETN